MFTYPSLPTLSSPSRPQPTQDSTVCCYHQRFGTFATKCRPPCSQALNGLCHTLVETSAAGLSHPSRLFYVSDRSTGFRFLIDTGAEVSVVPPLCTECSRRCEDFTLQAVNHVEIVTYGMCSLTFNLGLRHTF